MAKIHAGFSELKASHVRLVAAAQAVQGPPAHLLLFYAAECGLKYVHLRRNNFRTTEQLGSIDHDLSLLIKNLNLPASAIGVFQLFTSLVMKTNPVHPQARTRHGAMACGSMGKMKPDLSFGSEESVMLSSGSTYDPLGCPLVYLAGR